MTTTTATASSSASSTADIAAANRSAAQKLMASLGAGSGIDVAALAQNLTDAERIPREKAINDKIAKTDARISGYAAVKLLMSDLKDAMAGLRNRNDYNTLTTTSTDTSQFSLTADNTAQVGSHSVQVTQLARAQRSVTTGFTGSSVSLNNGRNMVMNLSMGDTSSITPSVSTTQGQAGSAETAAVTFQPLAAGDSVTIAGLTFTADPSQSLTADQVAAAFSSLTDGATTGPSTALGAYSGTLTGYSTGANASNQLTFTSSTPTGNVLIDLTATASAGTAPSVMVTQGTNAQTESSAVSFTSMTAGQSVVVAGLKFTASETLTAEQVAQLYANLQSGQNPTDPSSGKFSGTLSGFNASASNGSGVVTFTSTTPNSNVANISVKAYTKSVNIPSGMDTPDGVLAAINASGQGLKATLVNTKDGTATPYRILIVGEEGSTKSFGINFEYGAGSGSPGINMDLANSANQTAADAQLNVDGISFNRSTNTINDVLTGVTFSLKATGSSHASIGLTRDNTGIVDKFKKLVTAYQNAFDVLKEVSDPKSTLDTYGKTLVGDSTVVYLRSQLKSMFAGLSSTAGTTLKTFTQMGVSIDQYGKMSLDEQKLNQALTDNFDDVVKSMTGGYNNLGTYSTLSAGFAGDAYKKLSTVTAATGILQTKSDNATQKKTSYQSDLEKLKVRMDSLLARYTKQFGNMESLIAQFNSTKSSLKSTFDAMSSSNKSGN